jgi:hypothetical protein
MEGIREMKWFKPEEFLCKCGRPNCDAPREIQPALAEVLDTIREGVGHTLMVASGLRCRYWNDKSGGEPDSEHLTGHACDLVAPVSRIRFEVTREAIKTNVVARIGIGKTFVHIGVSKSHDQDVLWLY